ncbi:MAG: TonB-dependent receptor domain-containing protein, partial [Woeseiaceae bacterium]
RAGFELSESTELYTQLLWADYAASQALASTPMTGIYVRPDNPNIAPDLAALLASRPDPTEMFSFSKRVLEAGPRVATDKYEVVQFIAGANGDLPIAEEWTWDAYASWGNVDQTNTQAGNVSRSAFEQLTLAADHGASLCGAAVNPFGLNSMSEECAAFVTKGAVNNTTVRQTVGEAFVTGPLFEMPAGDVQSAVGVMYKRDEFAFLPDASLTAVSNDPLFPETERTDIVGFNAQDVVRGDTNSKEVYAEGSFPLLADMPAIQRLDLTLGYRFADHSTAGNMSSYKAEGIWDVSESFTVRGGYQRAVRAPNISELFQPAVINFPATTLGDPCSNDFNDPEGNVVGAQDDPAARALCVAQGIPEGAIDSYIFTNAQFQGLAGGNPDLSEETADTYTLGMVFQPADGPLSGFQASVDYYTIEIEDAINSIDADVIVERCFDRRFNPELSNDNFYCTFFERLPGQNTITNALEQETNIAAFEVEGVDLQV